MTPSVGAATSFVLPSTRDVGLEPRSVSALSLPYRLFLPPFLPSPRLPTSPFSTSRQCSLRQMQSPPTGSQWASQETASSVPSARKREDGLPLLAAGGFREVVLERSSHQQFSKFRVILLVFETADAIRDFLGVGPSDGAAGQDAVPWTALQPGELVAVCLKGDEKVSSRQ